MAEVSRYQTFINVPDWSNWAFSRLEHHKNAKFAVFASKHHNLARTLGVGMAITSSAMMVLAKIATVVETVFRILAHFFGALFGVKNASFKSAAKLLVFGLVGDLKRLAFSVVSATFNLFFETVGIARDPVEYTKQRQVDHADQFAKNIVHNKALEKVFHLNSFSKSL